MIDVSKFAFIEGTYPIDGESTRAIKSGINAALSDNKRHNFGAIVSKDGHRTLFSTDKSGLMLGATIYNDVVEHTDVLVVCSNEHLIYFLLIKENDVLYESILDGSNLTESQVNHLKLALFEMGEDAIVITDHSPTVKKDGSLQLNGGIELPYDESNVIVKPALSGLLVSNNLVQSNELKSLTVNGQRIQRQWYYSISSIALAVGTVLFLNSLPDDDNAPNEPSFSNSTLSKITEAARASRSYVMLEEEKAEAPNFEPLYDWYTKESASPYESLQAMHRNFRLFESVEGWDVIQGKFEVENGRAVMSFKLREGKGSDIQSVSDLAVRGNWKISFKDKIFTLFKVVEKKPLFSNAARFQISSYEKFLSTGIKDWWDNTSFEASDMQSPSSKSESEGEEDSDKKEATQAAPSLFTKRLIKISKPEYTSFDLQSFGSFLKGHPYSLRSVIVTRDGVQIEEDSETPQRRPRRGEQASQNETVTNEFAAFNAQYELILVGVTTR